MKLQLTNVGQSPIVVKDQQGYTEFALTVAPATTEERVISRDLAQRIAPQLRALETPVKDDAGNILVALRWAVLATDDMDDRAMDEGLAGLPALNELRAASYSTGGGGTDVVATGTGLLGNQERATLKITEGAARLDLDAVSPGAPSNAISVEVVVGVGALAISVAVNKITITTQAAGDTVADIATAINAHATAKLLVQATVGAAGDITAAQAEQWLTGGIGPGVSLMLNGTACILTEVTDTQLTFDIPTGISAASRIVPLEYRNGPHVSRLSVPVIA